MTGKRTVSVVIPVFNEEPNVPELVQRCVAACEETGNPFEIILVDDGSRDRSMELIAAACERHPGRLVGIFLNRNYGQHAAVMAGLARARGDIVVTLDADLQNPPEEIPRLVRKMEEGYDVVGTVRVNRADSLLRTIPSRLMNRMVRHTTGIMMHDYGCMLRAYRRLIVDAMLQCREHSTFIPILANSFARRTAEIEVGHASRAAGQSKYSFLKLVALQFDLLTGMTTFPLRLLSILGGLLSIAGLGLGVLLFTLRLVFGAAWSGEGLFTLFAFLFIFIGVQLIGMGLLGEYLGRIYSDVRARPRFFIDSVAGESRLPARSPRNEGSPA
jgi:undecaprenyl-phosphate 4-deoxy-4-formamido-L-arabinose transferase